MPDRPRPSPEPSPASHGEAPGADAPDHARPLSPADTAAYIGTLASELAELARSARLDTLAHLLEMARYEASELHRAAKRV